MVFDEMVALAESKTGKVNHFCEYENAYVFSFLGDEICYGGFGSPVVIPKNEDVCYSFVWALQSSDLLDGDIIREGEIAVLEQ